MPAAVRQETVNLVARATELRDLLTRHIAGYERIVRELDRGRSPADLLRTGRGQRDRGALSDAIHVLEGQRYVWRRETLRSCLQDGMTLTEFAELWGFSRQYAQKIAREIGGGSR